MSFLERLKSKLAEQPESPFEGFEGTASMGVSADAHPFEGFEGEAGIGVSRNDGHRESQKAEKSFEINQSRSESQVFCQKKPSLWEHSRQQTPIPRSPSKPSEGVGDVPSAYRGIVAELLSEGLSLVEAKRGALPILRARLRNDVRFYELQIANGARCLVCGGTENNDAFIPVLASRRGSHHWIHDGCWPEHVRRLDEKVEAYLREAGLI